MKQGYDTVSKGKGEQLYRGNIKGILSKSQMTLISSSPLKAALKSPESKKSGLVTHELYEGNP
jgi:hypothetical protein